LAVSKTGWMETATIRSQATIVSGRPARNLVLDNLASGTTEVGADLALADALDLNSVEPFTFGNGDPYFLTYISNSGDVTLNRFHSTCLGWTSGAKFRAKCDANVVIRIISSDRDLFLVFA
jgi:hypothetical protein